MWSAILKYYLEGIYLFFYAKIMNETLQKHWEIRI
jgi:hypothetical protein